MNKEIDIQRLVDSLITTPINKKTVEQHIADREGLYNKYYEIYGKTIGRLSITYVIFICIVVILDGFPKLGFHLSDKVIITLLCSTASSILGLMYIVANHLFPKHSKHTIKNEQSANASLELSN
jgi:hypothetical protein